MSPPRATPSTCAAPAASTTSSRCASGRGRRCSGCTFRPPTAPRSMRCTPRPRRWAPRSARRRAAPASAGGGYGFRVSTPEGHPISISSDVAPHAEAIDDRSRPTKLTHVVLNSAEVEKQTAFFLDVLGFKWSDSTFMMDFVRCCSDHHSVAFARGNGPTLNHMAYEMPNIDGLMSGAGRVRKSGYEIMWGVGRHGPGSNVFSYFVEPNGFVTEYTTEVEQVGDNYVGHDADWWKAAESVPVPLEHGGRAVRVRAQGDVGRTVRGREPALRAGDGQGARPLTSSVRALRLPRAASCCVLRAVAASSGAGAELSDARGRDRRAVRGRRRQRPPGAARRRGPEQAARAVVRDAQPPGRQHQHRHAAGGEIARPTATRW